MKSGDVRIEESRLRITTRSLISFHYNSFGSVRYLTENSSYLFQIMNIKYIQKYLTYQHSYIICGCLKREGPQVGRKFTIVANLRVTCHSK